MSSCNASYGESILVCCPSCKDNAIISKNGVDWCINCKKEVKELLNQKRLHCKKCGKKTWHLIPDNGQIKCFKCGSKDFKGVVKFSQDFKGLG